MIARGSKEIAWFENAKLGLFMHWGIYSATEGFYHGQETKGIVEWIQSREQIPNEEYEQFAKKLSADGFDAGQVAALAKRMGARYMVFTAKHHEGFAMYPTDYDDFSLNGRTGTKRDILQELTTSLRNYDIVPCVYYSQGIDFHEKNAMGNTWDFKTPEDERDFDSYFRGKCKHQLSELLTRYGDIGMVWFDVPWGMTEARAKELRQLVKGLQPDCLINGRLGGAAEDSDFLCMGDNEAPYGRVAVCAETCATTNDSWGYKRCDKNFKTPQTVIELLCAVCSKGANLLLNIGPKPDGSLPQEAMQLAEALGDWMRQNSEAVYDTQASPFTADFSFGWATQKENYLYLLMKEPRKQVEIFGLCNKVLRAESLTGESAAVRQEQNKLCLDLSAVSFCDTVTVIRLTLDGKPKVANGLFQQEGETVMLPCCACKIKKGAHESDTSAFASTVDRVVGEYWDNPSTEIKVNINGSVEWWKSEQDSIFWDFEVAEPGDYEVILYTATSKYQPWTGGHTVRVRGEGNDIAATLHEDVLPRGVNRRYFSETGSILGKVTLAGGHCTLSLLAEAINPRDPAGLYVTQMVLQKVRH